MKIFAKIFIIIILIGLSSCWVKNLNSAFEDKDVIFDESLVGTWTIYTSESIPELDQKLILNKIEDDKYDVVMIYAAERTNFTNEEEKVIKTLKMDTLYLTGRLGKIGSNRYFEMCLSDSSLKHIEKNILFVTPNYFIYKLNLSGNSLSLMSMNNKRCKKLAKQSNLSVFEGRDESILITAKTKQIRSFLKKYENDKELFGEEKVYSKE